MQAIAYSEVLASQRAELLRAQKMFTKQPNAANWTLMVTASLVWQQAEQLGRPGNVELRNDVMRRVVDGLPNLLVPEAIVRAMTGKSIGQCLKEAAA